jgi:hypothetical protein
MGGGVMRGLTVTEISVPKQRSWRMTAEKYIENGDQSHRRFSALTQCDNEFNHPDPFHHRHPVRLGRHKAARQSP